MRTIIESPTFQRQSDALWTEDERLEFLTWLSLNPEAGDVIPASDGARKVGGKRQTWWCASDLF